MILTSIKGNSLFHLDSFESDLFYFREKCFFLIHFFWREVTDRFSAVVAGPARDSDEVDFCSSCENLFDDIDRKISDNGIIGGDLFGHLFVPVGFNNSGISVFYEPFESAIVTGCNINSQFQSTLGFGR